MPCCHVLVHGLYRICPRHLTDLLVHIVRSGAGVVTNPNAKVLDLLWALLADLAQALVPQTPKAVIVILIGVTYHAERNNLAIGLLHLLKLGEKIPETRLGDNGVRCEYAHTVQLWGWGGIGRKMAANDLVFLKATCEREPLVSMTPALDHMLRVAAGCSRRGVFRMFSVFLSNALQCILRPSFAWAATLSFSCCQSRPLSLLHNPSGLVRRPNFQPRSINLNH